ncbi:MAG: EAL domain-containing protein [Gammaproteobacteria bacterium]|nr:EAL domain-containing protein [Gammaproteobacteria bacterium]
MLGSTEKGKPFASSIRRSKGRSLSRRVVTAILLCSTVFALIATGVQLLLDYRRDVSEIEVRMLNIERSYVESVSVALWDFDMRQIRTQIEGIRRLPDIRFVLLRDASGDIVDQVGARPEKFDIIHREMPVVFIKDNAARDHVPLGTLIIDASLDDVYQRLGDKVLVILVTQTIKTFVVSLFILFIFNRLVSQHLTVMARYASRLDMSNLGEQLVLPRKKLPQPDEFDVLVSAINNMSASIRHDVDELTRYRAHLEEVVTDRTSELGQKVSELKTVVHRLNNEINERELAERTLREGEERYRQLVEMSPDAIMIERDSSIVFANGATLRLLGAASAEQVLGRPTLELVPPEWHTATCEQIQKLLQGGRELRLMEAKMRRVDGTDIDVEVTRAAFQYAGQAAIQTVVHDITRHKQFEEQLRHQALYDALTGLPNRTLLMDRLQQAMILAERQRRHITVVFIDLDRFKLVNDSLGHDAGDELLRTVTRRMSAHIRKSDTLARLGGDEFILLLADVLDEAALSNLLQRFTGAISSPIILHGQEITLTCSIGCSTYPQDGNDAGTLLKHADTAMYKAKESGRNNVKCYRADMYTRVSEQLVMESGLRRALERDELLLHYQPQLDLRSGAVVGIEALIRWRHPELGLVAPGRFIPLAEETGLIAPIGEWVIRTACAQARAWQRAGLAPIRMAVNLSMHQLVQASLEAQVGRALVDSGLAAEYLEFEITESMSMNDPELTLHILTRLKAMGTSIAIDDFGCGYSNLGYLKRFPVDRIKLDRSFVSDLVRESDDGAIAKAIIGMAHSLHLPVVAEGVEHREQLTLLLAYGCDEMQGYYYSPPLPADECAKLLRSGRILDVSVARRGILK